MSSNAPSPSKKPYKAVKKDVVPQIWSNEQFDAMIQTASRLLLDYPNFDMRLHSRHEIIAAILPEFEREHQEMLTLMPSDHPWCPKPAMWILQFAKKIRLNRLHRERSKRSSELPISFPSHHSTPEINLSDEVSNLSHQLERRTESSSMHPPCPEDEYLVEISRGLPDENKGCRQYKIQGLAEGGLSDGVDCAVGPVAIHRCKFVTLISWLKVDRLICHTEDKLFGISDSGKHIPISNDRQMREHIRSSLFNIMPKALMFVEPSDCPSPDISSSAIETSRRHRAPPQVHTVSSRPPNLQFKLSSTLKNRGATEYNQNATLGSRSRLSNSKPRHERGGLIMGPPEKDVKAELLPQIGGAKKRKRTTNLREGYN